MYLTNTLEEAHELTSLPLFTQWLAEEANRANEVKQEAPIMVVLGNPPYSGHSANTGAWISGLLRGEDSDTKKKTGSYFEVDGKPLGERNSKWLNDDYVKFIRFAQWRIEQTGYGVLAFVTNHGYLDNPTFRGMRQCLMQFFDDIYVLDLHGNAKRKEHAPDGSKDKNVFDIQQGVAIGIFVKHADGRKKKKGVQHAELWGVREGKYQWLRENDLATTQWQALQLTAPFYLFVPQDEGLREEYKQGWKLTEMMPVNVLGFQTHRDQFAIDFDRQRLYERIAEMRANRLSDAEYAERYGLRDNRDWQLNNARKTLRSNPSWEDALITCLYRPFDWRYCYFSEIAMDYPRRELVDHVATKKNLCLNTVRQTKMSSWQHIGVSDSPAPAVYIEVIGSNVFPLYLYPKADPFDKAEGKNRRPNLSPAFIEDISRRLKLTFISDCQGDLDHTFGPEDVFHYTYAVLHSPTYRRRYAEFLKIDFPRVPLTTDVQRFRALCQLGRELVALHLMEKTASPITRYPVAGDNKVDQVRYTELGIDGTAGRVWINKNQYFEGVPPAVWGFHIGGYQVAQKWLKDHKGRQLTYDDLTHYQRITSALVETLRIQNEIDGVIGKWPIS